MTKFLIRKKMTIRESYEMIIEAENKEEALTTFDETFTDDDLVQQHGIIDDELELIKEVNDSKDEEDLVHCPDCEFYDSNCYDCKYFHEKDWER